MAGERKLSCILLVEVMAIELFRGAHIDLFQGLADDLVAELLQQAQPRMIVADEVIFNAGSPARTVHVLVSGCVRLVQFTPTGERVIIQYVRPGETFGTPALLDSRHRADAMAVTNCTELQWPSNFIREVMSQHPLVALNAMRAFETRLESMENRLRDLSNGRVEQRIAQALSDLADRFGRLGSEGTEIPFPISRQDLADLSGTTLHTVSRILGTWEVLGHIKRGRRRIVVTDLTSLAIRAQQGALAEPSPRRSHRRAGRRSK
jgi:CRP/FNR family transcriptional regulator, nitrogen oxide reductase regulator